MRHTARGFLMLESLACLFLVTIISIICLGLFKARDYSHLEFANQYLKLQTESFALKERNSFEYGVSFNSMGHVNKGNSIAFGKRKVVIHLGNGFITIE